MIDIAAVLVFFKSLAMSFAWYAVVCAGLFLAERRWPAGEQPDNAQRAFNFSVAIAVAILVWLCIRAIETLQGVFITRGLVGLATGGWQPVTFVDGVLGAAAYAFVYDFFQYWFHRAVHKISFLWPVHALHHDDERINSTTAMRNTFLQAMLGSVLISVPVMIICGFHLVTYYASIILFSCWGFFNHANVRLDLGPLTRVVSGPAWHRVHHGRSPEYYDRNFAAFFPILDVIFGTYHAPVVDRPLPTGLQDRPQSQGGPVALARAVFGLNPPDRARLRYAGRDVQSPTSPSSAPAFSSSIPDRVD